MPHRGFYQDAVKEGIKAIDTAFMYGSEEQIGKEVGFDYLLHSVFLSTKTVPPMFRKGFDIPHGTSKMHEQLEKLQRSSVNALFNHHDPRNMEEWALMSDEIDKGRAQVLGASSVGGHNGNLHCVHKGKCRHHVSLVQDTVSPCDDAKDYNMTIDAMLHKMGQTNATLVGHGMVHKCRGEPMIASIAKRLKQPANLIALRWSLQRGVPIVVQTTKLNHVRENLRVFDFELQASDMYTLNLVQKLYGFKKDWFEE